MPPSSEISDARLIGMMHEAGIRPSMQRLAVLSYVANSHRHPSADEIFTELSAKFPTLSRTTVYNSLHLLVEASLVRELEIESSTMRYDLAPQPPHGHFMCKNCGKIFDTDIPGNISPTLMPGFEIDNIDIFFKGLCPECKKTIVKQSTETEQ